MKVKYVGATDSQVRWGSNDDPRGLLEEGKVYEAARIEQHTWHTKYYLVEFPGKKFNSVHFETEKKSMEMDEARSRTILGKIIQEDGDLYGGDLGYIAWYGGPTVTLDGEYTADELEAIVWWMRNKTKEEESK